MSLPARIETELEPIMTSSFVVGPDGAGHWVAVETHGRGGGIFVSRDAAIGYARAESCHRPGAVAVTSQPIELR